MSILQLRLDPPPIIIQFSNGLKIRSIGHLLLSTDISDGSKFHLLGVDRLHPTGPSAIGSTGVVGQCKAGKEKDVNNVFDRIIQEPEWLVLTLKGKAGKEKEEEKT